MPSLVDFRYVWNIFKLERGIGEFSVISERIKHVFGPYEIHISGLSLYKFFAQFESIPRTEIDKGK